MQAPSVAAKKPPFCALGPALTSMALIVVAPRAAAYRCPQSPSPAKTDTYQGFLGRVQRVGNDELPYRLFVPKDYDPATAYPLVLYLHHAGLAGDDGNNESGWDNCVQLTSEIGSGDDYGGVFTHRAVDENGNRFDTQAKYPHFVLAPHTKSPAYGFDGGVEGSATRPEHATRPLLWAILDAVKAEFNIDSRRLYVTGISMGCYLRDTGTKLNDANLTGRWVCWEFGIDKSGGTGKVEVHLWVNGTELRLGPAGSSSHGMTSPSWDPIPFDLFMLGLDGFQNDTLAADFWIDDLLITPERVGCPTQM